MCSLRLQFADLFHGLPLAQISVNQTGAFYFSQAWSEDVFKFFQKQTNDSYRFISERMDVFIWLVFTSNLISQTTWLKVKLKLVRLAFTSNLNSQTTRLKVKLVNLQPGFQLSCPRPAGTAT